MENGLLKDKVFMGEYGSYLQDPMSTVQRAEVVGRRMLICRKNAGMSQNDVCSIIGLSPQTYSGYENGKHEPTIETLVRLAYLYGVSLDYLMGMFNDDEEESRLLKQQNIDNNDAFISLQVQMQDMKEQLADIRKKIDNN